MGNINEPNNSNDNTQNNTEESDEEQNPNSNITPPSNMPSGNTPPNNMEGMMNRNPSNVSGVYYILLSLEAVSLSALITYLIMSNFNKKNMKETFKNDDKISIFILTVIVLSASYMLLNMVNSSNSNGCY